jgi:hypothetical protein
MSDQTHAFIRLVRSPLKFRLFLLSKLPSAYFAGVRVKEIDEKKCVVRVPYKWFSRNPFRSTYFACMAMAGEMSTGALAMAYLYQRKPAVSMLVVSVHADYFKKATGITEFTCEDGEHLSNTIQQAIDTGEATAFNAKSTGRNEAGEIVAEMLITWSFKCRSQTKK